MSRSNNNQGVDIPPTLKNKKAVSGWLISAGYKISQSGFYKHCDLSLFAKGKKKGPYTVAEVKKYIKKLEAEGFGRENVHMTGNEDYARKTQADASYKETMAERERFKLDAMKGKFIEKNKLELEVASRAAALDKTLDHLYQSKAVEIIALVGGDASKAGLFIEYMIQKKNQALTVFANTREWQVIFDLGGD